MIELSDELNKKINGELSADKFVITVQLGVGELKKIKIPGKEKKQMLKHAISKLKIKHSDVDIVNMQMQMLDDMIDAFVAEAKRYCCCFSF